jgi:hypothetical protein
MFSTVPGFDSPKASRRSENDVYVSARAAAIELLKRKLKGDSFSNVSDDMIAVFESARLMEPEGTGTGEGRQ